MCVCMYTCVHAYIHVGVRVCILISLPPCFALVQKGLVPTTWCRAASAQPIPAWIATLGANQKLPAAFAVCPLSIFSNASLNPLVSLGCCITPQFNMLPYHKFLMSVIWQALSSTPAHECEMFKHKQIVKKLACACYMVTAVLLHHEWKRLKMFTVDTQTHCCTLTHCLSHCHKHNVDFTSCATVHNPY